MEKNIISITGLALVEVTYNYEIKDLKKFEELVKEKRINLSDIQDLYNECLLEYDNDVVQYIDVDFGSCEQDEAYHEINGSNFEVDRIIEENKLDELEEWYG